MLNLKFIKERRIGLGLSTKEMATKLGFKDASTYFKYEKGDYSLKASMLPKLAEILECKIDNFFEK